jgi:hypothetical protein
VTQVSASPADPPGPVKQAESEAASLADGNGHAEVPGQAVAPADGAEPLRPAGSVRQTGVTERARPPKHRRPLAPSGPVERFMSAVIRKLSWSRLANPKVAVTVAACGLLLGMIVGATAPNAETLEHVKLPLTRLASWLLHHPQQTAVASLHDILTATVLYSGDILACLGLAGMLWAHSQGWRPDPRRLLLVSTAIVAIMVCLTPVGSSDTASYAAYGRIAALGRDPYSASAVHWLGLHDPSYMQVVGYQWTKQPSVYGPVATWVQSLAASIGGPSVQTTIWVLMILNGIVFLAVGLLLLKTSDDPLRATLFWTANPVLIQQLVGGGHFDTFVAAAAIAAIQLARRTKGAWSDVLIGVLIGLGCGVKITTVLVALGLAWPLLRRHEYGRIARIAVAVMATVALEYSFYGVEALKPLFAGSQWVTLPSPLWFLKEYGPALGASKGTLALVISCLWLAAMFVVAWLVYQRISADQPREVVAPFALTYAWVVVSPWVFAWYTALPWVALTQVPRNRMTRWLTIVTVVLALWHSSGGWVPPGRV